MTLQTLLPHDERNQHPECGGTVFTSMCKKYYSQILGSLS